jgi:hypothetical protein
MTPREKAIKHVSGLIADYRARLKRPHLGHHKAVMCHERIRDLTREMGILQTAGEEGDRHARSWVKVCAL